MIIQSLKKERGTSEQGNQRDTGEPYETAKVDTGSHGSACRSARAIGLNDVTRLSAVNKVCPTLVGNNTSDSSILGSRGNIIADDCPCGLSAVITCNILGYIGQALSLDSLLGDADDVVEAQRADGILKIGEEFIDTKGAVRVIVILKACNLSDCGVEGKGGVHDTHCFFLRNADVAQITLAALGDVLRGLHKGGITTWLCAAHALQPSVDGRDYRLVCGRGKDVKGSNKVKTTAQFGVAE